MHSLVLQIHRVKKGQKWLINLCLFWLMSIQQVIMITDKVQLTDIVENKILDQRYCGLVLRSRPKSLDQVE